MIIYIASGYYLRLSLDQIKTVVVDSLDIFHKYKLNYYYLFCIERGGEKFFRVKFLNKNIKQSFWKKKIKCDSCFKKVFNKIRRWVGFKPISLDEFFLLIFMILWIKRTKK